jgi:hypothetical protein
MIRRGPHFFYIIWSEVAMRLLAPRAGHALPTEDSRYTFLLGAP